MTGHPYDSRRKIQVLDHDAVSALDDVESGRSPATPAWTLLGVTLVIVALVAVALTLTVVAYLLAEVPPSLGFVLARTG